MIKWIFEVFYSAWLGFFPKSPQAYVSYGLWLEKNGRLADAVNLLSDAVQRQKLKSFALLNNLGYYALCLAKRVEVKQQYLELAEQCLLAAHAMQPENKILLGNGADYFMYCQQYTSAIEILAELLAQDPQDPEVVFKLAMAYAQTDRLSEAEDHFVGASQKAQGTLRLKCLLGYRWFLYYKAKRYRGDADEVEVSLGKYLDAAAVDRALAELQLDYPGFPDYKRTGLSPQPVVKDATGGSPPVPEHLCQLPVTPGEIGDDIGQEFDPTKPGSPGDEPPE